MFNYAVKMLNDRMAAEDAVQNVFIRFFENIANIQKPESAVFWLFTTLRNEIYSVFRSRKYKRDQFNVEDTEEIEIAEKASFQHEIELNDLREIITAELGKMDPDQKEVYVLKEFGNRSYREISEIMGIDENLVKSRLFKVRQKLIGKLSKIVQ